MFVKKTGEAVSRGKQKKIFLSSSPALSMTRAAVFRLVLITTLVFIVHGMRPLRCAILFFYRVTRRTSGPAGQGATQACDKAGQCDGWYLLFPGFLRITAQVHCKVSDWSEWGACSVVCGGGVQSQTRNVEIYPADGGADCPDLTQSRPCNDHPCGMHLT